MQSVARRISDRHVLALIKQLLVAPVDADPAGGHPDESPPTDGVWLLRAVLDIAESTPKPIFWAGGYLGSSDRYDASHVAASAAAVLTAVVVLPTPPFWLATAMIRAVMGLLTGFM